MMTPQEVANCTFAKSMMGGYNMASVDDFLDKLTEDYSALYKENAALKAKLKVLVDKMAEYREMEDAMRSTLLTAQKMATSMVAEAEQKRTALITSASSAAKARQTELEREIAYQERRLEEVRRGVDQKLEQERKRLAAGQQALRGFIQDVRTVCNDQLAMLELLPELPVEEPPPPQVPAPAAAPPAAPVQEAAVAASATYSFLPATSRLPSPLRVLRLYLIVGLDPAPQLRQRQRQPVKDGRAVISRQDQALLPEPAPSVTRPDPDRNKKRRAALQICRNSRRGRAYSITV